MRRCLVHSTTLTAAASAIVALRASHARYGTPGKVRVHVRLRDGASRDIDVPTGISLMQALRDVARLDVPGSCDGEMMCCTCHVYFSEASFRVVGEPTEEEQDLLDKSPDVKETSRLSCQVDLTEEMEGLEVKLPGRGSGGGDDAS